MPNEHVLSGLRLFDFTRALAGPTCTRMLGAVPHSRDLELRAEALRLGCDVLRGTKY
jgi:hypothetical protein